MGEVVRTSAQEEAMGETPSAFSREDQEQLHHRGAATPQRERCDRQGPAPAETTDQSGEGKRARLHSVSRALSGGVSHARRPYAGTAVIS